MRSTLNHIPAEESQEAMGSVKKTARTTGSDPALRAATLALVAGLFWALPLVASDTETFDHGYRAYGDLLRAHVVGTRVDYGKLQRNRAALDEVVDELGGVTAGQIDGWSREQQIAYWINAYNAFTLQAIVEHYPIKGSLFSWLSLTPRNSIKQIDGVWTKLRWRAAGAEMTLDEIEHETLRANYDEPRLHFAVNCASVSCPPIRRDPYTADRLDRQLTLAARDYLASELGLRVDGATLRVSSLLNWYGEDFIDQFSHLVDATGSAKNRTILGVIAKYGPADASRLAQSGTARIRFLKYDWSLNDVAARD